MSSCEGYALCRAVQIIGIMDSTIYASLRPLVTVGHQKNTPQYLNSLYEGMGIPVECRRRSEHSSGTETSALNVTEQREDQ
ncbi:hypothetical protein BDA96_02G223400 [Sorghum bicolor]|uniref:Uncharacterized protein n=2 Tax=Sorghum bicolor TaxID=4558 RepID=A0A921UUK0_SORBI|nr:hypothetical protein BDA96_02G223400 [Sorghum bicolor]KXG35696.1 hypothetical protein SORBI_3002G212800 [Sorghum bicolor]